MVKRFTQTVAFVAIVAAVALAQDVRIVGAVGRGVAGNREGHAGHFGLEVKKAIRGDQIRMDGRFEWANISPEAHARFQITMGRMTALAVNAERSVCEFAGHARLVRQTSTGPVATEGRIQVRVVDRVQPDSRIDGDARDGISWQFVSPTSNVTLSFEGLVREGDIKVFARHGG
jgi:hypothetical protein